MSDCIVVYAARESHHRLAARAINQPDVVNLPPAPLTHRERTIERQALVQARCLIFVFMVADLERHSERLCRIAGLVDNVPRLLVTDGPIRAAAILEGVRFDGMVTMERLARGPIDLPYFHPLAGPFERWAASIANSPNDAILRRAIAHALRHVLDPSVARPGTLGRDLGVSSAKLARLLRSAVGGAYSLGELLSAVTVIAVRWKRGVGTTWPTIAAEEGFTLRTIRRKIQRWPGCKPSFLTTIPTEELLRRFENDFIQPLIAARSPGATDRLRRRDSG